MKSINQYLYCPKTHTRVPYGVDAKTEKQQKKRKEKKEEETQKEIYTTKNRFKYFY